MTPLRALAANLETLNQLLRGKAVATLTTVDVRGALHSRPIATVETEFDGDVWFFTRLSTTKVHHIAVNPQVNVAYVSADDGGFVSLTGTATVVQDRVLAEELWKPEHRTWFPDGLEDPELALIRVEVQEAQYWDGATRQMHTLFEFSEGAEAHLSSRPGLVYLGPAVETSPLH